MVWSQLGTGSWGVEGNSWEAAHCFPASDPTAFISGPQTTGTWMQGKPTERLPFSLRILIPLPEKSLFRCLVNKGRKCLAHSKTWRVFFTFARHAGIFFIRAAAWWDTLPSVKVNINHYFSSWPLLPPYFWLAFCSSELRKVSVSWDTWGGWMPCFLDWIIPHPLCILRDLVGPLTASTCFKICDRRLNGSLHAAPFTRHSCSRCWHDLCKS